MTIAVFVTLGVSVCDGVYVAVSEEVSVGVLVAVFDGV
jgi:hypothetical protein